MAPQVDLAETGTTELEPDPRPASMPYKILTCREAGHHFPWGRDHTTRERLREVVDGEMTDLVQVTRRCSCCKSERVDVYLAHSLRLLRRRYRHVDEYKIEPGTGRLERGQVRRELLRRYL